MNRKKLHRKIQLSCILLIIGITCFIHACEKEEVADPAEYEDFTSVVGSKAREITFFSNNSTVPDDLFPTLSFPDNCFAEDTRITVEYHNLWGMSLPDSLATIASNNYLWFFDAEHKDPGNPVSITIPYSSRLDLMLLQGYEYIFRLYKVLKGHSFTDPENLVHVNDYVRDTVNNNIKFTVDDFNYGYMILFPEPRREDFVIISATDEIFRFYENNTFAQQLINQIEEYFQPDLFGRGFYEQHDTSYYNLSAIWGDFTNISFSFAGKSPGTYSGNQISVSILVEMSKYQFENSATTVIEIDKYGDIGENIQGTITGALYESKNRKNVEFYIFFRLVRLR